MKKIKDKILLVGDVHGNWKHLNAIIHKYKPDNILQCGDFGFFANYHNHNPNYIRGQIKNKKTKIYWCDGNHEDHLSINRIMKEKGELIVAPNVFYQHRGSVTTLPDGRKVLWLGGAWSIDWVNRTDGLNWFKEEELLKEKDIAPVFDMKQGDIDIVISHTCPTEFIMGWSDEHQDPSRKALSFVLNHIKPKLWFFGHWHDIRRGEHIFDDNTSCKWRCLTLTPEEGCARWLKDEESL